MEGDGENLPAGFGLEPGSLQPAGLDQGMLPPCRREGTSPAWHQPSSLPQVAPYDPWGLWVLLPLLKQDFGM